MFEQSPLVSLEGFQYLSSTLLEGRHSRDSLDQLLYSLIVVFSTQTEEIDESLLDLVNKSSGRSKKRVRKECQWDSVAALTQILGNYERILEIGCGDGSLAVRLAMSFPGSQVLGVDINQDLIEKNQYRYRRFPNLGFQAEDIHSYSAPEETDLVVSLHGCGNLTDRVVDIAVGAGSDIVCVPCCYAKIKRKPDQPGPYFLPRSRALHGREEFFREKTLKTEKRLEGRVNEARRTIENVLLDFYRVLINFDRLFFLRENGYDAYLTEVTDRYVHTIGGSKYLNTSLRFAVVGKKL